MSERTGTLASHFSFSDFERGSLDWRTLKTNPKVYDFLEYMSQREYHTKVKCIVLFGSVARGQARLGSDIDIAVISNEPLTRAELNEVHPDIDHAHFYSLDYKIINVLTHKLYINKLLNVGHHIKREGVLLYAGRL